MVAGERLTAGIAPAQLGRVVTPVKCVTVAVNTIQGRDNHLAEVHVGGDPGVFEQDTAGYFGTRTDHTAMPYPGGSDDDRTGFNAGAGADVHRAGYLHTVPGY